MISGVKARINAVAEFNGKVTIAHEDLDAIKEIKIEDLPAVELWFGETQYGGSDEQTITRQTADIRVLAMLYCDTADLVSLEKKLVQAIQGYVSAAATDNPMEAVKSRNWIVAGPRCARLIELSMESQYQQINFP